MTQTNSEYRSPALIYVGATVDLTGGGNHILADKPGDPTGGYNRGWGGSPELD